MIPGSDLCGTRTKTNYSNSFFRTRTSSCLGKRTAQCWLALHVTKKALCWRSRLVSRPLAGTGWIAWFTHIMMMYSLLDISVEKQIQNQHVTICQTASGWWDDTGCVLAIEQWRNSSRILHISTTTSSVKECIACHQDSVTPPFFWDIDLWLVYLSSTRINVHC
jgi:hypothetical protein